MAAETSFGRRRTPDAPKPPPQAARPAPLFSAEPLSPEAQAFQAELAASRSANPSGFAAWRRQQAGRRAFAWVLTLILLLPGVICFLLQAPATVSLGLEGLGMVANWWLRRERRRHLQSITAWEPEPLAD